LQRFQIEVHEKLEKKFTEFSESQLFLEMICNRRLEHSELVKELLSFQSVLSNVILHTADGPASLRNRLV